LPGESGPAAGLAHVPIQGLDQQLGERLVGDVAVDPTSISPSGCAWTPSSAASALGS
jgi:hypothetical protein